MFDASLYFFWKMMKVHLILVHSCDIQVIKEQIDFWINDFTIRDSTLLIKIAILLSAEKQTDES